MRKVRAKSKEPVWTEAEILAAFAKAINAPDASGWSTGRLILKNLRDMHEAK